MNEIKRMPIKEFRAQGYLQELNRQFLHLLGLALETVIDNETGDEKLGGVWDYREDPEGMLFGEGLLSLQNAERIDAEKTSKAKVRRKLFGNVSGIQPIK